MLIGSLTSKKYSWRFARSHRKHEQLCRESLELNRRVLGEDHPEVATSLANLGNLLNANGDPAGAVELSRQVLALRKKLYGEGGQP